MTIPVFVITAIWMLAAMVVAVRQALDYRSTGRAIAVCVIGWILAIVFAVGLGLFWSSAVSTESLVRPGRRCRRQQEPPDARTSITAR